MNFVFSDWIFCKLFKTAEELEEIESDFLCFVFEPPFLLIEEFRLAVFPSLVTSFSVLENAWFVREPESDLRLEEYKSWRSNL